MEGYREENVSWGMLVCRRRAWYLRRTATCRVVSGLEFFSVLTNLCRTRVEHRYEGHSQRRITDRWVIGT